MTINKREEIFRRCVHRYKHFLGYLETENVSINENIQPNMPLDENFQSQDNNFKNDSHEISGEKSSLLKPGKPPDIPQPQNLIWGRTRSGKQWKSDTADGIG